LETQSKKAVIKSAVIGIGLSLTLFFVSWWTHSFDSLVFPQFPGFLVSSLLWGLPGFPHHDPDRLPHPVLFPFVMISINALFYGVLVRVCLLNFKATNDIK
jgi:hypothetical protein